MSKHQIASLASKLLGIYFALQSLAYLPFLGIEFRPGNVGLVAVSLICFFLALGAGLFLMFRAERVAAFLVNEDNGDSDKVSTTGCNAQMIAYTTLGLFLTIQAIPHFINQALSFWFSLEGWLPRPGINLRTYIINVSTALLQLVLGIWLLLGARGLAEMLKKVRRESEV